MVIHAVAIGAGDDLVIAVPDRLDSDDALALLNAAKQQFQGVRIHLLCGFGSVQIERNDGGGNCASFTDAVRSKKSSSSSSGSV